ncbi:minor capsid protein, partial [Clostridium sporogenes]|uniref:minor capsid protein n=1 Tax=Clostridium sporogenes TaxID=1509 RepID=UPI002238CF9B
MKNSEYWEKRIANNTWKTYNSLEEKNRALLEMYQEASLNISDELYRVAEKMKTSTPMLSDMHKFNRLTKLQKNIENIIGELGEEVQKFYINNATEGFKETYKNIRVSLGDLKFTEPPKKLMEQLLRKQWEGSNFSTRLWKNTQVLVTNLNDILTNGLIQGKTITEMAIQLNNRMNKEFNICHRLVRTETMHYLNESSLRAYMDSGVKKIQYWAASDERTCPRCGVKHGNPYIIKDAPVLPLHANCRCTYIPIVDEKGANKDYYKAKEDINNEFNRRYNLDNGLNNENRKLNIPKETLKHSNEGDFTNPRNPKKIKPGEIRLK